jgi:hypothetical protein
MPENGVTPMANRMARSRRPGAFLSDDGEAARRRVLQAAETHLGIIESELGQDPDDDVARYVLFVLRLWRARLEFLAPPRPRRKRKPTDK